MSIRTNWTLSGVHSEEIKQGFKHSQLIKSACPVPIVPGPGALALWPSSHPVVSATHRSSLSSSSEPSFLPFLPSSLWKSLHQNSWRLGENASSHLRSIYTTGSFFPYARKITVNGGQPWEYTPIKPVIQRQRQEDCHKLDVIWIYNELQATQGYIYNKILSLEKEERQWGNT